jgi:hypothetical protein
MHGQAAIGRFCHHTIQAPCPYKNSDPAATIYHPQRFGNLDLQPPEGDFGALNFML